MDFSNMEVTIDHIADAGAKIKAYATVTFDGMFKVHGVRLAESKQGLNIFMPQKAFNKNGKTLYTDVFHPITSGARTALKEAVIDAYRKATKEKTGGFQGNIAFIVCVRPEGGRFFHGQIALLVRKEA